MGRHITVLPALALAGGLVLGACVGDDDQVLPPVDPSSPATSARSPAPSGSGAGGTASSPAEAPTGIDLSNAQQAAFEKALKDVAEWASVGARLNRNPQPSPRAARVIRRYTFDPYSSQFFTSLRRYDRAGVHIEGRTEVIWRVPRVVDLNHPERPKVVWKQCTDSSQRRVLHGRTEIPQDEEREVARMTLFAGDDGRWRVTRVEALDGSC